MSPTTAPAKPARNEVNNASSNGRATNLPYYFAVIPLDQLMVGAYQRPLTSFVEKIEREFDPALVGTLCLSKRSDTQYAVIDGQTRAEGMRRVGLKDAPAIVYTDLTPAQEASLFAKFQTERRGMTSASRFNAQVVAGDETAIAINEVVEGLGFIVEHNSSAPNALRAVAALEYAYHGAKVGKGAKNRHDSELLAATLETIRAAWPKLPDTAKSALTIRGLSYFLAKTDNVDHERLAKQLSKITPSALAKRAEALREGHGQSGNSPSYMADAIESQYRKR